MYGSWHLACVVAKQRQAIALDVSPRKCRAQAIGGHEVTTCVCRQRHVRENACRHFGTFGRQGPNSSTDSRRWLMPVVPIGTEEPDSSNSPPIPRDTALGRGLANGQPQVEREWFAPSNEAQLHIAPSSRMNAPIQLNRNLLAGARMTSACDSLGGE